MIGGVILLAGHCHSLRDVEGATGQGASLASASGPPLHLLSAGRRLSLLDVEGAAGQGASLTSASGPPLHLVQLTAAATLAEALARKIKRGLRVSIQFYGSETLCIVQLRYSSTVVYGTISHCVVLTEDGPRS